MLTRRTGLGLIGTALLPLRAAAADDVIRIGAAVSLTGKLSREGNQLKNGYVYWEKLVADAHATCPYSNATRGNIDVSLTAHGKK